jgi:hypothetical protein
MKKKVRKFASGGDIVTGLGAVLLGKALYDKYKGGDKDSDKRGEANLGTGESKPKPKINEIAPDKFPSTEDKATSKSDVVADKDEARERALRQSKGYPEMGGASSESDKALVRTDGGVNKPKPRLIPKKQVDSNTQGSNTTTGVDAGIAAGNKRKQPSLKPGESKVEGEGSLKPYPANLPSVKAAEQRKFLQKKAGLSGKGITTPGDPNAKGSTQRGRSANPIQGTIDNATRSTVRTDAEKMRERALEVERRRKEENKKAGGMIKKYASGGSVSSASKRADGCAIRGKTRA